MAHQHDPNRPGETPTGVVRATQGYGMMPIIAGAVLIALLVASLFTFSGDDPTPESVTKRDAPQTTSPATPK